MASCNRDRKTVFMQLGSFLWTGSRCTPGALRPQTFFGGRETTHGVTNSVKEHCLKSGCRPSRIAIRPVTCNARQPNRHATCLAMNQS